MVPRFVRRERRYCLAMCAVVLVLFTVAHWRSYTILTKESNRNTLVRSKLLVKDLKNRKNTSRGLRPGYVAHSVITDAICSVKGVSFSASCHEGIIGVPSHDIVKYQPNAVGQFICRDGILNISWSAVNDDYCDCNDGSDEPGTGACANTRFYCIPQRKYIPSSRVNDGICDCCDGSDEWKRLVVGSDVLTQHNFNIVYSPCKNFCPEKG